MKPKSDTAQILIAITGIVVIILVFLAVWWDKVVDFIYGWF